MVLLSDEDVATLGDGGFVLKDGILGESTADVLEEARALAQDGAPAGIGRAKRSGVGTRGDSVVWVDPPALAPLFDLFEAVRGELNRSAYLGLRRFDVQLARYPGNGASYARHRDAFRPGESRVATAIYYLNPDWRPEHGGALRLHLPGGPVDVQPLLDRLVLFLSERVEHEVLPAWRDRLAVTGWYYAQAGR